MYFCTRFSVYAMDYILVLIIILLIIALVSARRRARVGVPGTEVPDVVMDVSPTGHEETCSQEEPREADVADGGEDSAEKGDEAWEELHCDEQPIESMYDAQEHVELILKMHRFMEEEKYFLNPDARLDDFARVMGTNRTYVTQIVRKEFGMTFIEYINVARIQHSQRLLYTHPSMALEDVAVQSGFQSASNYCRAFKRYTGTSPIQWLRETNHNVGAKR